MLRSGGRALPSERIWPRSGSTGRAQSDGPGETQIAVVHPAEERREKDPQWKRDECVPEDRREQHRSRGPGAHQHQVRGESGIEHPTPSL